MAKSVHNDVLDAALDKIATANQLAVCSTQPTTRAEAITTYKLAITSVTPGDGSGSFAIADGSSSGRKITVSQQASITVDSTGSAAHIALVDSSILLYVTTCTTQGLTASNTVTVPAWTVTIADPS